VKVQPFERIVEEHGAVVLRVCRALLGPDDAQDAWSETFLAALRAYPDLRPDSNVEGWLVTIAHRKAIDVLRRQARQPQPRAISGLLEGGTPAGLGGLCPPAHQAPADAAPGHASPMDDEVLAAVRALPPKQQAAVVHHYLADLPYREVGRVMGVSPEAARRSAADGIAALRAALTTHPIPSCEESTR
jgi:RNA polymerase sigma factor (sigma-70 family)